MSLDNLLPRSKDFHVTTGLATTKDPESTVLVKILENAADRLKAVLPDILTPFKMAQLASLLAYRTPNLLLCDPESIITSIMQVGSLGLDLNPTLGEAYLIPRKNYKTQSMECTVQIGFKGLEKLACATGAVSYIQPREVRENDIFEVEYDPDL